MVANNTVYARHYAASIIDEFEGFLEDKGIIIPNEERDNDEDLEGGANIYGDDFDDIESRILPILEKLMNDSHAVDSYNITSYNDDEENNISFNKNDESSKINPIHIVENKDN